MLDEMGVMSENYEIKIHPHTHTTSADNRHTLSSNCIYGLLIPYSPGLLLTTQSRILLSCLMF